VTVGVGNTREEILTLLKQSPNLSVGDIAQKLGITEMAVRRHLNNLERDQLLSSHLVRQSMGRPSRVYHLTEKADDFFPKAYTAFAIELIEDLGTLQGADAVGQLFQRRADRLYRQYKEEVNGEELEEKLHQLVRVQNRKGYMVELEKQPGQLILKEYNCPIAQVAKQFPQACDGEVQLFERLLGCRVEQIQCMAKGATHCIFAFSENKT
jgi:predicted ArsR family transcriptional regulator